MGYWTRHSERSSFGCLTSMNTETPVQHDDREQLVEQLAQAIWLRLALVLVPASNALRCQRPELARLMNAVLTDIRGDITAYVLKYDVVRQRDAA